MDRRTVAIVLGVGAAALILISSLTKLWYSFETGYINASIGLRSMEVCPGSDRGDDDPDERAKGCQSETLRRAILRGGERSRGKSWVLFGEIAFFVSFVSAAAAAGIAGMAAAKKQVDRGPAVGLALAIGLYAIAGIGFVASKPSEGGDRGPSMGLGFFLALSGVGMGVGAAFAGSSPGAPALPYAMGYGAHPAYGQPGYGAPGYGQPGYGAPPPQVAPGPPCNTCGQPVLFVAQYQRWWCARCQKYL